MKKPFFFALTAATLTAVSALACPGETYRFHQVSLDANGVLTRSEYREVPAPDFKETQNTVWTNVVVDKITLVSGDEVKLNAAPGMMDATFYVVVKRDSQKSDTGGIFYTTYSVRQIMISDWGGGTTEKSSLVTVKSNYRGEGKRARGCGKVIVKELPSPTPPALPN